MQVEELLDAGASLREVFVDESAPRATRILDLAQDNGVPVVTVSAPVIDALSETTTPQGVVAVVDAPRHSLEDLAGSSLVLVLAEVRDPGNAGTLVRAASAAGSDGVVFTTGTVDPWHPKTVRAAAGNLFATRVVRDVSLADACDVLGSSGLKLIGTAAAEGDPVHQVDLRSPHALVLGNEAWGLPEGARERLDQIVHVPMPGRAESLNVGIAGSIVLFEAVRQRTAGGRPSDAPCLDG